MTTISPPELKPFRAAVRFKDGKTEKFDVTNVETYEHARRFLLHELQHVQCALVVVNDVIEDDEASVA